MRKEHYAEKGARECDTVLAGIGSEFLHEEPVFEVRPEVQDGARLRVTGGGSVEPSLKLLNMATRSA